jgi:hypothetical protein
MRLRNVERIFGQYISKAIIAVHLLAFSGFVISLLLINPSPAEQMGYFSFELMLPFASWPILVVLVASSVLLIELRDRFALPAIVLTMLAMRLPLLLMFKLPYEPDSYTYMSFIQQWHTTGKVDLTIDARAQFWPVMFLLLYAFRVVGVSEIILWTLGPPFIYMINAILIVLLLRRFLNPRLAEYALLLISLTPTFNFYYYQILAPQLVASTLFLAALIALFDYEQRPTFMRLTIFIGTFVALLFTHHLTSLLLAAYTSVLFFERPLSRFFARLFDVQLHVSKSSLSQTRLGVLGVGTFSIWVVYLIVVARDVSGRFASVLIGVLTGKTSTYPSPPSYSIGVYAFNLGSVFVYGFRLLPIALGTLLIVLLSIGGMRKILSSRELSS